MVILLRDVGFPIGIPTREWLLLRSLDEKTAKRSNLKTRKNKIVCEDRKIQELTKWKKNIRV